MSQPEPVRIAAHFRRVGERFEKHADQATKAVHHWMHELLFFDAPQLTSSRGIQRLERGSIMIEFDELNKRLNESAVRKRIGGGSPCV